jgi:hypothetical protein
VYAITDVQANKKGLKLNGTLQLLFCGKETNLLGEHKYTFRVGKKRGAFLVCNK